jgi:hypothetical protein
MQSRMMASEKEKEKKQEDRQKGGGDGGAEDGKNAEGGKRGMGARNGGAGEQPMGVGVSPQHRASTSEGVNINFC